jgi:protease-4
LQPKDDLNKVSIGNYIEYVNKNASSSSAKDQVAVLYASERFSAEKEIQVFILKTLLKNKKD